MMFKLKKTKANIKLYGYLDGIKIFIESYKEAKKKLHNWRNCPKCGSPMSLSNEFLECPNCLYWKGIYK